MFVHLRPVNHEREPREGEREREDGNLTTAPSQDKDLFGRAERGIYLCYVPSAKARIWPEGRPFSSAYTPVVVCHVWKVDRS